MRHCQQNKLKQKSIDLKRKRKQIDAETNLICYNFSDPLRSPVRRQEREKRQREKRERRERESGNKNGEKKKGRGEMEGGRGRRRTWLLTGCIQLLSSNIQASGSADFGAYLAPDFLSEAILRGSVFPSFEMCLPALLLPIPDVHVFHFVFSASIGR